MVILFSLFIISCQDQSIPRAKEGILDLTQWNPHENNSINLDGEWELYWEQFLSPFDFQTGNLPLKGYVRVPGIWNGQTAGNITLKGQGYATYRLQVLLPKKIDTELAIRFGEINSAYKAFINGEVIAEIGRVGKKRDETRARWIRNIAVFKTSGNILEIIIQVANFHFITGGICYHRLELGRVESLERKKRKNVVLELFLFAALFVMGVYHIGLYFSRVKEYSPLFLGIFCLLFSLQLLMTGEKYALTLFFNTPFEVMITLAHLPNYIGLPVWFLFVHSLFPSECSRKWLYFAVGTGCFLSLVVILTPGWIYSWTMYVNDFFLLLFTGYITYVFIMAVIRKREGAKIYLVGWIILFFCFVIELLGIFEVLPLPEIIPFAIFCFLFFQAFMLVKKYSRAFIKGEQLSAKLLTLDKLKDDFLAKTSHELRTPISAIINLAQSMGEKTSGSLKPEQRKNLKFIATSGRRLLHLINDILDFSKLKNKQVILNKKIINLYPVVNMVFALLTPLIKDKTIDLVNRIPEYFSLCFADENRVEQILLNMVGNAVKFTEKGSVVVDAKEAGTFVEITVTDTGIGIPEDMLPTIFNSFEQVDSRISNTQGAGLGLTITKELVELHGGTIRVESIPGKGTVFLFTLPVFKGKLSKNYNAPSGFKANPPVISEDAISIPTEMDNENALATILIVDDEPINLQVLINFLTQEGYAILTAFDGEEALKMINNQDELDIVILDIMLPRLNGFEVCKIIRGKFSLFELPVLMLTAKTRTGDILAGFTAGANDYVIKPFDKHEVLSRIKTLIKLKKLTDENQVLQRLYRLKKRILHLISHELENTLYGISFSTRQLIKTKKFNDPLTEETVISIQKRAEEVVNIFDKFSELSRLESGNIVLHKEMLDLGGIMNQLVKQLQITAAQKKQRIIIIKDNNDESFFVAGDKFYLIHIIENLIGNAIKFSPPGKSILIKISTMIKAGKPWVCFKVKDEGPGLTKTDMMNLFKEFQKLSARPTGGELSSGLGLSIVKHLVDLHNGRIEVTGQTGKGATFIVTLPGEL